MRKLLLALGVFLQAAPLSLLAGAAVSPAPPALWLLPLALGAALAWAAMRAPRRMRLPCVIGAAALAFAAAALLDGLMGAGPWCLLAGAAAALAAAAAARLLAMPRDAVPGSVWYAGLVLYPAARVAGAVYALTALPGPLHLCALMYVVTLVFALNSQSLWEGMGGGRAPSRLMVLRNSLLAGVLAAAMLILSHLSQIRHALGAVLRAIVRAAAWLAGLFAPSASPLGAPGAQGGGMPALPEAGETSVFWVILEKAAKVLAACVLIALALWMLRAVFRALKRALRALIARLRAYAGAVNGAYEDTVESLIDWGDMGRALRLRRRRSPKADEEPWERLSARQRVRRSYRAYLRRHPDLPESRTARQALGDPGLAAIYEAARYSSREITEREAEESRRMAK